MNFIISENQNIFKNESISSKNKNLTLKFSVAMTFLLVVDIWG